MLDAPSAIIVDSGPIVALFNERDAYHQDALRFVQRVRARLISSIAVITEVMYVLDGGLPARTNLLTWIERGGLRLIETTPEDFARIAELIEKHADLPMDFTDAVVVALCERLNVRHVATVDRDFAVYRHRGKARFVNVFLDGR